jgi:hypothetical protein
VALHFTLAQLLGAAQVRLQAWPAPQAASQALRATHLPEPLSQYCPVLQVIPLHGLGPKQPATQEPSTHVSWPAQTLPAHGSLVATHEARQLVPAPHVSGATIKQGSGWQLPARQAWPWGQGLEGPQVGVNTTVPPRSPPASPELPSP